METKQELAETIRRLLSAGQYRMDDPDAPFSGMAGIIADRLWDVGYRQRHDTGVLEYTLVRTTDTGDEVLIPPSWGNMDKVFEYLHYHGGMVPGMSIYYRPAEMWEELDPYWWEDEFDKYQKERGRIYEQG